MNRSAWLTLAAFLAFGVGVAAQDKAAPLSATGTVKAVSGSTFAIDTGKGDLNFSVDANTHILAKGATTATRAKKAAGEPGITIADVVHEGDQVLVKYAAGGTKLLASEIQVRARRPLSAQPVK